MNLKDTYNKIAKDWFYDHKEDDWWKASADKFLSRLKTHAKILDVGCGAGLKTKYLAEKGFVVTGIDFSEEMIKLARGYYFKATFYIKDVKEPLNLGLFDGIFAAAVLLHIPKTEVIKVLQNFKNSLMKGGYIYIYVKELRPGAEDEQNVVEDDYNYKYERFFSFFTLPEIKHYFMELGMQVIHEEIIYRGDTNWIVVIAKK